MKLYFSSHFLLLTTVLFLSNTNISSQTFNWAKAWGSTAGDENTATVVKNGFIYNTGHFTGTCDFDPGPGTNNKVFVGVWDIYISKSDTSGNLIWVATFGSTDEDKGIALAVDDSGFVYGTGFFKGTVDFDPGSGTVNKTSKGAADVYVIRLDPNGNLSWIATSGSNSEDRASTICLDSNRNVYVSGSFYNTVDFDPGTSTFNLTSKGNQEIFIQKLSAKGNFIDAIRFGDWSNDYGTSMWSDKNNLYITGGFSGMIDFNPGQDTLDIISSSYDPFVVKFDFNIIPKWARRFGSNTGDEGKVITVDLEGNVISAGYFQITGDFDPGIGKYNLSSKGGGDIYIHKLDSNGYFLWARSFGNSGNETVTHINTDAAGNIYIVGNFKGSIDLDPGPGVSMFNSGTKFHSFILKLDRAGNFVWAQSIGSAFGDACTNSICIDEDKFIYASGYFSQTTDFDPTSSTKLVYSNMNSADAFILKWGQDKCSDMTIVFDSVFNFDCDTVGRIFAKGLHGKKPYSYQWSTSPVSYDSVLKVSSRGFYELSLKDSNLCTRTTNILIGGPDTMQGFDLNATLVHSPFRTGFNAYIYLDVFNDLCTPVSGEVKLLLNSNVKYDSANVTPIRVNGDTIVWSISNLNYGNEHFNTLVYLTTKTSAILGDKVCFKVFLGPKTGDRDTLNNIKEYCSKIINAYDPNDKNIYPEGKCSEAYILKDQPIEYRIRFQNTGNADAINILITDTLSNLLDVSTLEIKSQSHPGLITELVQGNVIRFNFKGIHLPDSLTSPAGSQGYIVYVIKPKLGIAEGSKLKNRASIYFDYNPAVITNSTLNTMVSSIPFESTSINKSVCRSYVFDKKVLTKSGVYNATYQSISGCDSFVTLTLDVSNIDTTITQNGSTLRVGQQGATYRWLDCNDGFKSIPGAITREFTFQKSGTYAAEVTVNGCSDTTECYNLNTTSLNYNTINNQIKIWPNPSNGIFNINLNLIEGSCELRLYNSTGQLIKNCTSNSDQTLMELKVEGSGIYLLEIEYGGKVYRFKLINE